MDSLPSPSSAPKLFPPNPQDHNIHRWALVITRGITASWARGQQRPLFPARSPSQPHTPAVCVQKRAGGSGHRRPSEQAGPWEEARCRRGLRKGPLGCSWGCSVLVRGRNAVALGQSGTPGSPGITASPGLRQILLGVGREGSSPESVLDPPLSLKRPLVSWGCLRLRRAHVGVTDSSPPESFYF